MYDEFYDKSPTFQKMLKGFCAENSMVHLKWTTEGEFEPNQLGGFVMTMTDYTLVIRLNEDVLIRYPKLFIYKTMIHEAIHARIYMRLLNVQNPPVGSDFTIEEFETFRKSLHRYDFPTLFDYYQKFSSHGSVQHNYMADYYIDSIVAALMEMDAGVDEETCRALAWCGLKRTKTWNSLPQSERDRYTRLYYDYVNNTQDLFEP